MTAFIYPYKAGSQGATALSTALGLKRIALTNSKFKGSPDKIIINWGSSELPPEVMKCKILNSPEAVSIAANKLTSFRQLDGSNLMPFFTQSRDKARQLIENGRIVVERHKLTGNSGDGIRIVERVEDLEDCPLYVEYIPKKQEYRVHILKGIVVDVQRKSRRHDVPDDQINWRVRNHANGFIFARHEGLGDVPRKVLDNAKLAVYHMGLDFGAVDVVFNEKNNRAYVLEVNTAPGMEGETLDGYASRFRAVIDNFGFTRPTEWLAEAPITPTPTRVRIDPIVVGFGGRGFVRDA